MSDLVWIDGSELQVGDVVLAYRLKVDHPTKDSCRQDGWERKFKITVCKDANQFGNRWISSFFIEDAPHGIMRPYGGLGATQGLGSAEGYWWLIERRKGMTTEPVAPAPTGASAWNGTCARCGRGTYTGLFATEHEGGGCP